MANTPQLRPFPSKTLNEIGFTYEDIERNPIKVFEWFIEHPEEFALLPPAQRDKVLRIAQSQAQPTQDIDLMDPKADDIDWITTHFWIPELKGPIWLADYQKTMLRMALSKDENGLFNYSLIVWSDIKKSIKSTIAAAVALRRAFQLDWGSIKVIGNDQKQAASRSYYYLTRAIRLNPEMQNMVEKGEIRVNRNTVFFDFNNTTLEAIPVDPGGESGGNDDHIVWTEAWSSKSKAAQTLWTEMVIPPQKFGKGLKWVETYAGYTGDAPILEPLYEGNVKEKYRIHKDYPIYKNGHTLVMWNQTPRLPWQSSAYYCIALPEDKNDLRVLTKAGWIAAEDITLDHELATTRNNLEIEYQKPSSIFRKTYSGELLRLKHSNVDLLVTPNHRIYCDWVNHTRNYKGKSEHDWKFIEAKDATKKQGGWIPGHGNWVHAPLDVVEVENETYNASLFIELLGWYIAEGNVGRTTHVMADGTKKKYPVLVSIAQDEEKNGPKHKHLVSLCERLGLNFKAKKNGVFIFNARLARYMEQFGKSYDKYIPRFVLDDCSQEQMKLFLFGFASGDGTRHENGAWTLYTNSNQLKLDLYELAFKCGYRVTDNGSWSSSPETGRLPIHHVRIMKSYIGWVGYGKRNNWNTEVADAEVWCPTVPNGAFCVMVNGKTMWTGNSQQAIELQDSEFRRVHRNEWVGSQETFLPPNWWDECYEELPELTATESMILGVDAAVSGDCFAVVGVTKHPTKPGMYSVRLCKTWVPPKNGKLSFKHPNPDINANLPDGYITDVCNRYRVKMIVYDPYQLHSMATEHNLNRKSAFWEEFQQGTQRLESDSGLLQMIREETITHPGFKDLTEHVMNADSQKDSKNASKLRLVKSTRKKKIDAAVALSMALYRAKSLNL